MKGIKHFLGTSFRTILVIAAVINLIALFAFNYSLPSFITSRIPFLSSGGSGPAVTTQQGTGTMQIVIPEGALEYSGGGAFEPTADVTVRNADGSESSAEVTWKVREGDSANSKFIEYSATGDNGITVHAKRALVLPSDYSGPQINVSEDLKSINRADLTDVVGALSAIDMLSADDGFGNDITSDIKATTSQNGGSGDYLINLSVKNSFGDSYNTFVSVSVKDGTKEDSAKAKQKQAEEAELMSEEETDEEKESETENPIDPYEPKIVLTTDRAVLSVGSEFYWADYVKSVKDSDGNDLWSNISIEGSVDTSTPGEYEMRYWCTDNNGNFSRVVTLTVEVDY